MNASNIGDHYYQLSSLPIARKEWFSKYKNVIQQAHRENGKIVLSRIVPNYQSSLRLTDVKVCEQHITKSTLIKIGHAWLYIKLKGILYKLVHKNSVIHLWIVFVQFKKKGRGLHLKKKSTVIMKKRFKILFIHFFVSSFSTNGLLASSL